jgi:hypothetical protein
VDEFIARENIKRFREQLAGETDDGQRHELNALLDQEERRLAEALTRKREAKQGTAKR